MKPAANADENEALKISKISCKLSPIRCKSDTDDGRNGDLSQESDGNYFLKLIQDE